ncbi:MAG: electron transfer flavoprotein subunit alpha/FixB family protein [Actinobacteria bacterium]|nr:electron transfer flavoprotein subunit alpha/FixB family protein [Actinomycetota bacterium]
MRAAIFVERHGGKPTEASLAAISAGRKAGAQVETILCGDNVTAGEVEAMGALGIEVVHVIEHPRLAEPLPQPHVDALCALDAEQRFDLLLFSNSTLCADLAAAVAVRTDAGINWDLIDLRVEGEDLIGTQPIHGDSALAEVGWIGESRVALLRTGAFDPPPPGPPRRPEVRRTTVTIDDRSCRVELIAAEETPVATTSLRDAERIVAGGRGVGGPEGIDLVRELATAIGAAPAVTLPVVERGWAPYSMQVGQTGTIVRPRLYMAFGISGQIQHRVGMERSETIVAVNTDENALIFQFADLAVVADAIEVIPSLIERVADRDLATDRG